MLYYKQKYLLSRKNNEKVWQSNVKLKKTILSIIIIINIPEYVILNLPFYIYMQNIFYKVES